MCASLTHVCIPDPCVHEATRPALNRSLYVHGPAGAQDHVGNVVHACPIISYIHISEVGFDALMHIKCCPKLVRVLRALRVFFLAFLMMIVAACPPILACDL